MMPLEVRTEHLLLRQWGDDDVDAMAAVSGDPQVMEFFPSTQDRARTEQARAAHLHQAGGARLGPVGGRGGRPGRRGRPDRLRRFHRPEPGTGLRAARSVRPLGGRGGVAAGTAVLGPRVRTRGGRAGAAVGLRGACRRRRSCRSRRARTSARSG
nr:hypothetical protein [Angustibacter aerolatus]